MYRLSKNIQPKTTYIGLPVTFETDLHIFNHYFSIVFKIFCSETCQTCDEWITEDADNVYYVVHLHQLNTERACAVMTYRKKSQDALCNYSFMIFDLEQTSPVHKNANKISICL
jgi:hypothetical protein